MKRTNLLALLTVVIFLMTVNIYAQYGGGSGTQADPYLIETATHLNNVRNNLNSHFRQTADIDLDIAPYNQGSGWQPIGGSGAPFTGNYDGDGHIVYNLMINRADLNNVGLFGFGQEANLSNLAVLDAEVIGGRWTGILAGDFSSTNINAGNITNCITSGTVRGDDRVGGLAGFVIRSSVINSGSSANVSGINNAEIGAGGLVGFISTSGTISNCFATGSVSPINNGTYLGGLVGRANSATITNSFSTGAVSGMTNVGGLIGAQTATTTTGSYWNTQTSQQNQSADGNARNTDQMTYPYSANTYINWNFEDIWAEDAGGNINDGYPYLFNVPGLGSEYPNVASNPIPGNDSTDVSVDIEFVAWSYQSSAIFQEPVGFRVYMNATGEFGEEDDFVWVDYDEEQVHYSTGDILPEYLRHGTTYRWKVVPTTRHPDDDGNRNRGDAQNVPIWSFTTEFSDNPMPAFNPNPADDSIGVAVDIANLSWTYESDEGYADPVGFRVYMNTTDEFGDDYEWVAYLPNQSNYGNSDILPEQLEYDTVYYWKVVPTTNHPDGYRGDAMHVPVWSFTTIDREPRPATAVNPHPAHMSTGVTLGLTAVSWDYTPSETHTDPAGFRVYLNTTGNFAGNAPYDWVPFVQGQVHYASEDIVPTPLDWETIYYWRVVPTTEEPTRNDAEGVVTWRFTSGTTDVEEDTVSPYNTELIGNYPNPFNPETTISFSLQSQAVVSIEVFDIRGTKVKSLLEDNLTAGTYQVNWDGVNDSGKFVGSGVYFYRMTTKNDTGILYTKTEKMILMK